MLRSLEFLRILSAIIVIFCHLPSFEGLNILKASPFNGAIGVDIFFVISGVVISISIKGTNDSAFHFLCKRLLRVLPLYILVTLSYLALSGTYNNFTVKDIVYSLMLIPSKNSNGIFSDPIVYLGWTLRFELFFYCLAAITIKFGRPLKLLILMMMAAVAANYLFDFYFGEPIILMFLGGFLIGWYKDKIIQFSSSICFLYKIMFFLIAISLFVTVSTGTDSQNFASDSVPRMSIEYTLFIVPRFIAWGVPSILLVFSALLLENDLSWKGYLLGKYTYSVYLLQVLSIPLANRIYNFNNGFESILVLIFIVSALSFFTYKFFESPINKFGRLKFSC